MSQIKRQYLRLEDITEKTYLTQGDVWGAIEDNALSLCALINATELGAFHPKYRGVVAIFDYQGTVRLTRSVSKSFASSLAPQRCKNMVILQPENIQRWKTVLERFPNATEAAFPYQELRLSLPEQAFLAQGQISASLTAKSVFGHLLNTIDSIIPNQFDALTQQYPKQAAQRLNITPITVESTQLRVNVDDLVTTFGEGVWRVNGYDSVNSTVGVRTDLRLDAVHQRILIHPIAQIAYRVLESNPKAKANKIWNLIRSEVNQSGAQRVFDTDSVIDEMTLDHVTWFGRGDAENSMSYDSFRKNTLVDVRELIKGENNKTSS
ncbi:hypothetical protein ACXHQN_16785 [Vibrio cincinnatiensis]